MKAISSSSGILVPMVDGEMPEYLRVAGVLPATAKKILADQEKAAAKAKAAGEAFVPRYTLLPEAEFPEGAEVVDIADEASAPVVEVAAVDPRDSVEIPADWASSKAPLKVKIAKALDDKVDTVELAEQVIAAELERRRAAAKPAN